MVIKQSTFYILLKRDLTLAARHRAEIANASQIKS